MNRRKAKAMQIAAERKQKGKSPLSKVKCIRRAGNAVLNHDTTMKKNKRR